MHNRYKRAGELTKEHVESTAPPLLNAQQDESKPKKNIFVRIGLRLLITFARLILVLLFLFCAGLLRK